jgi:translation initiation factor 1 (eIF-1/SUI1)
MIASRGMGIINPKKLKNCGCSHSKPKKMKAGGDVFKSHMMYDMKTGKEVKAPTKAKHLELKKKGYGHTKPKMNVGGKVSKVVKGLEKASKTHAKQAKTLKSLKLKKGGTVKDACYQKVKASYKVFPSAYASGAIAKCRKKKAGK